MTTAPPDWAATKQEVHCPLCDYNLRGLIQPRCPECGYQFAWPDVLEHHPYLFEHYPERNVVSFFQTITRNPVPVGVRTILRPNHRVVQFRASVSTVIASQIIVLLIFCIVTTSTLMPYVFYYL